MSAEPQPNERFERAIATAARLLENVETVVRGKTEQIRMVIAAFACRGHVLFEDVPGTAKTVLARSLAGSIEGATAARVQCTPDLQPTDVTGLSVYNQRTREFEFHPGPVFGHVVLVDEINRAMPKTQSALLEAMAEHQVTVDGVTHALPDPFLLLATENPIEHEGTFMLPEAQLDRFFLKTELGYPTVEDEILIVQGQRAEHPLERLRPVVTLDDVRHLQDAIEGVYTDPVILRWIVELVQASRDLEETALGASVRASLALERVSRAWALLQGRDYVRPGDVEALFISVLGHRIVFTPSFLAQARRMGEARALETFRDLCFARAPRPEPDEEHELRVLGAPA
ncbi:MAG TPA: MoxR family ATPase [Gaiellaceae bacterium]|nr:MoxR family ATPase [Gaiellaceae bacterium]